MRKGLNTDKKARTGARYFASLFRFSHMPVEFIQIFPAAVHNYFLPASSSLITVGGRFVVPARKSLTLTDGNTKHRGSILAAGRGPKLLQRRPGPSRIGYREAVKAQARSRRAEIGGKMDVQALIIWLVVGAIAGWLAGMVVKGGG